ncbi:DUF5686 and carboxypeptidase-like regulatory domain-containing protein [Robertkochia flava]|uniref:DUF5686 and carboxypeptidase-like regulatory domain-containing protein n=1 Tax=Robertkochia flava TaxID=3447986 RepID=UPI001CCCB766|nr:DUF5686 and carboxypeptidase-like regulatory domain-containing protein [Robertkochia marina]
MRYLLSLIFLLFFAVCWSQTKVSGKVVDEQGKAIAYANVLFQGTFEGTITDENGTFYLESDETQNLLEVSLLGYTTQEIPLEKRVNYNMRVVLTEGEVLEEVVIYVGKQPKKNNPAVEILKKIWEKKRVNGLNKFDQYHYSKYEKIEFDLNTIDSALMNNQIFKGMEFVFDQVDTSNVTGKTYLPIFINESASEVYGDNKLNTDREIVKGNKTSGFDANQAVLSFIQDLYASYDIYNNYIKLFDKSFVSPLSKTGVDVYNYVLADSTFRGDKWCYNIVYYPRRSNELTFKGDFWVNDTTFAVKEINMQASKSANVNWVKDLYIEQEFDVLNDSVFVLKRDYVMSDFSIRKKEESRGIYGKRTTIYADYQFDKEKPRSFYDAQVDPYNEAVFNRTDEFWETNRLEKLNEDEQGIYTMLDTLRTVPKFKMLYNAGSVLASGYYEFDDLNLDFGPIFSAFGYNEVEGIRLRGGGRTYFTQNDQWRVEGYMAYGFRDRKFKYGVSARWMLDRKHRFIISAGTRRDIEQLGVSLTATNDVLGRSFASSALFTAGSNTTLTNIRLTTATIQYDFFKNFTFQWGMDYRRMRSALPERFSLSYLDPDAPDGVSDEVDQFSLITQLQYTPGRRTLGYGVDQYDVNDDYARIIFRYTLGMKDVLNSDFDFKKMQFYYRQPLQIGGVGRMTTNLEAGKIFGTVPLSLLSPIPGNQTYFSIFNTFPNLNFYEFVTDTYLSVQMEHNFNGRLFARIPLLKKWNLRELIGLRAVWGSLSQENIDLNAPTGTVLQAPEDSPYYEYSFGVGNIFKVFRIDFSFRGNYLDLPEARPFAVTGAFELTF